jgi:hypothetical protein
MRRVSLAAGAVLALSVAGCTEYWAKPGAGEREFEVMRGQCNARGYQRFPPLVRTSLSQEGHYAPVTNRCVTKGNSTECTKTGGQWVPPSYTTVDDNERPRDEDIRSCFFENGWAPVEKKS